MKNYLSIIFLILLGISLKAQQFPVQVTPQVIPPHAAYWSDYANGQVSQDRMRVNLFLTDLTIFQRQVRLKMYLEGNGVQAQTTDRVLGADPLFLDGGTTLTLGSIDLAPYFDFQNLQGINAQQYGQVLPEGMYQLCFEVYDFQLGLPLSSKSCTNFWITLNEPPLINVPFAGTNIEIAEPQNINVQWTPRHQGTANVVYDLEVMEIWDKQMNPIAAALSSPPIYSVETRATNYLLGPADLQLLAGKRYAFRVRARAQVGIDEVGIFKNNGYSEVTWIDISSPCEAPYDASHEVKSASQILVNYAYDGPEVERIIKFREIGDNPSRWYKKPAMETPVLVKGFRPGHTYEYKIVSQCHSGKELSSQVVEFVIPKEERTTDCGKEVPKIEITNFEPLATLQKGDIFTVGDFEVTVTEASGGDGRFTGKGTIQFPVLVKKEVVVVWNDIFINTDLQLTKGEVKTDFDPAMKGILDVDEAIDDAKDVVQNVVSLGNDLKSAIKGFKENTEKFRNARNSKDGVSLSAAQEYINENAKGIRDVIDEYSGYVDDKIIKELKQIQKEYEKVGKSLGDTLKCTAGTDTKGGNSFKYWNELGIETDCEKIFSLEKRIEEKLEEIKKAEEEAILSMSNIIQDRIENDSDFKNTLLAINFIKQIIKDCNVTGFETYKGEGIVPKCLWENVEVNRLLYYSVVDPSFVAGMTDETYETIKDLILLPKTIVELGKILSDVKSQIDLVKYAYTLAYLECDEGQFKAAWVVKAFESVEESSIWSKVISYTPDFVKDFVSSRNEKCGKALALRKEIGELLKLVDSWEEIKTISSNLYKAAGDKIEKFVENQQTLSNEVRYENGKRLILTASFFIGAGEVKAVIKGTALASKLKLFSQARWVKVVTKWLDDLKNPKKKPDKKPDPKKKLTLKELPEKIREKVSKFDKAKQDRFLDDFNNGTDEFRKALEVDEAKLVESWEVVFDAKVSKSIRTDAKFLKRFQEIDVPDSSLNHANKGDFTYDSKTNEISRMKGGGHGQDNIDFLKTKGFEFNIVKTYENGVRIGNVPLHKSKGKRTGTGQSWFPRSWTVSDIENAGKYVSSLEKNINAIDGEIIKGVFKNVVVGVQKTNGKVGTIFADAIQ